MGKNPIPSHISSSLDVTHWDRRTQVAADEERTNRNRYMAAVCIEYSTAVYGVGIRRKQQKKERKKKKQNQYIEPMLNAFGKRQKRCAGGAWWPVGRSIMEYLYVFEFATCTMSRARGIRTPPMHHQQAILLYLYRRLLSPSLPLSSSSLYTPNDGESKKRKKYHPCRFKFASIYCLRRQLSTHRAAAHFAIFRRSPSCLCWIRTPNAIYNVMAEMWRICCDGDGGEQRTHSPLSYPSNWGIRWLVVDGDERRRQRQRRRRRWRWKCFIANAWLLADNRLCAIFVYGWGGDIEWVEWVGVGVCSHYVDCHRNRWFAHYFHRAKYASTRLFPFSFIIPFHAEPYTHSHTRTRWYMNFMIPRSSLSVAVRLDFA